ncbi:MAG: hypothetical protein Unbinned4026contig1002_53 [Prokaryotic dsDNA virus sp.]|nr:MAG: hypothetical protein Unbinned4026contig1002_53 [Prokaryotic dsDNA virus sp.]|tara:strand:- start:15682 stop:16140 length:459 start_codon:yes stop_codon:yes gene_type:complete
MAFATRSDLTVYQPDIGDMGLSTSQQDAYVTQAIADVQRDIRNRWWSVYQANKVRDRSYIGSVEMENSKLTDSQWTRATVYRTLGFYICPALTKFNSSGDEDRFQQMGSYYRTQYEDELQDILRDGVEYDQDGDSSIANSEKEAVHTLRLVR